MLRIHLKAFFFQFFLVENRFFRIFHVQIPVSEGILEHDHTVLKKQRHIGRLVLQWVSVLAGQDLVGDDHIFHRRIFDPDPVRL